MIKLTNVKKSFLLQRALYDVSLTIKPGELIGVFGANGSGKTTLIKSILGLSPIDSGEITLDGEPITYKNRGRLSFATCEHSFFSHLTPKEHKEFFTSQFPEFREERFDLLMNFFDLPYRRRLRSFSTGQKNQFETILALSQGADYIFMDEPFSGSDIFRRDEFYKLLLGLLEPHETIVLSTHLIDEVKYLISRAIVLKQGDLVGDILCEELEEQNINLVEWIKERSGYSADHIMKTLKNFEP